MTGSIPYVRLKKIQQKKQKQKEKAEKEKAARLAEGGEGKKWVDYHVCLFLCIYLYCGQTPANMMCLPQELRIYMY